MVRRTPKRKPSRSRGGPRTKRVNLALQGGGSHGAFAWGVLDGLLEDGRLDIEGLSGTSAGSMNAVVYAYGRLTGGSDGARQALHDFWHSVSASGRQWNPLQHTPWDKMIDGFGGDNSIGFQAFKAMTAAFSPYQLNPYNLNPLREVLEEHVDFEALHGCQDTKLFLSATNVRTGRVKVFNTPEITADVVMATACLPLLFQAVEIDGEHYWDGGYMGNPVLFPLFYETESRDVIILHINPIERPGVPTLPHEIENRVNEISFNSSLIKELRAVAFVQKLLADGWLKEEHRDKLKHVLIHSVRADKALCDLSVSSKFSVDWDFLVQLRDRGRATAAEWLAINFDDIGQRSSVDLRAEFL
jgi:NTE family protein